MELTSTNSGTSFDVDNDGYLEASGWAAPDDGFLVIDLNDDGKIDKTEELAFAAVTPEDDTDIEAVRSLYDETGDGWLSSHDGTNWAKFRVWQDKNGNAIVDEGELKTLDDWHISKISLISDHQEIEVAGHTVHGQTSYEKTDGTIGKVADVSFDASSQGYKIIETVDGVRIEIEGAGAIFAGKDDLPVTLNLKASDFISAIGSGGNDIFDASAYTSGDKSQIEGRENETLSVSLAGNGGDDTLKGGAGNDYLDGGDGKDKLSGGAGDDVLFVDQNDTLIDGEAGADIAIVTSEIGVQLDLAASHLEAARGWSGDDVFDASQVTKSNIGRTYDPDGIYTGWGVSLDGGAGNDKLVGSDGNDSLSGGSGADRLIGGKGDDYIVADADDTISAGDGVDTVIFSGSDGIKRNVADLGAEIVGGTEGDDTFTTDDAHVVVLSGDRGDDSLSGSRGDDTFIGGLNDDILKGGAGDDTYRFSRGDGQDEITDRDQQWVQVANPSGEYHSLTSSYTYQTWVLKTAANKDHDEYWAQVTQTGSATVTVLDYDITITPQDIHLDGGSDTLAFGAGITREDLVFEFRGADLYVGLKDASAPNAQASALSDSMRLTNWTDAKDRIETIEFADGSKVKIADLVGSSLAPVLGEMEGTEGDDTLTGTASNEKLSGGKGNDLLDGMAGDDRLEGGAGNDTYTFGRGSAWDVIKDENRWLETTTRTEDYSQTYGPISVSYSYTKQTVTKDADGTTYSYGSATGTVQVSFTDTGPRNITETVWKEGDGGSDTLTFGAGVTVEDVAIKIRGDDLLIVLRDRDATDASKIIDNDSFWALDDRLRIENWANANNRLETFKFADGTTIDVSAMLAAYTGGAGDEIVTGDEATNWLAGAAGNDVVLGLGGKDVLIGGSGDDVLSGGEGADLIYGGEGKDRADYSDSVFGVTVDLTNNANNKSGDAEGDQLFGIEDVVGSRGNDKITGDSSDSRIWGGDGEDTIDGGAGVDTVSYSDSVFGVTVDLTNSANNKGGFAQGDVLINIENVTGSSFDDSLTGDGGDNRLEGGVGKDILIGGAGIDTAVYENSVGGVSIDLGANEGKGGEAEGDTWTGIENVLGSDYADSLTGDANANRLEGGQGSDTLQGGGGADTLVGGDGSDTASYRKSASGVTVNLSNNTLNAGGDAAGDNLSEIENLVGSAYDDDLTGDDKDNALDGGRGNDTLTGGGGNDTVSYAASQLKSVDDLTPLGAGDKYRLTQSGVTVNLAAGTATLTVTTDIVEASTGNWKSTVSAETHSFTDTLIGIENVVGTAFDDSLTGDGADNKLVGGDGKDSLTGGAGNDWLDGGTGNDIIDGGDGTDTVYYGGALAAVTANLATGNVSGGSAEDSLSNVENLIGGIWNDALTGNAGVNRLEGGAGNDRLDGGAGADMMLGGFGDDTYVVDHVGDQTIEDGDYGVDTVESSISWTLSDRIESLTLIGSTAVDGTGNALDNVVTGNAADNNLAGLDGDDTLDGGVGADKLTGGKGDDLYIIDNVADQAIESKDEGLDRVITSVSYTLGNNIEALELIGDGHIDGTGNDLDNEIVGNDGDNHLSGGKGNDHIFGGLGADTIDGGDGVDLLSYAGSDAGVTINLLTGKGSDGEAEGDILSNIENVTGSAFNDTLTGNDADNRLIGGKGNDALAGGKGNDTYVVDALGDTVTEALNEGTDSVESGVTFTLGANLEHLTLTGAADLDATGNELDNKLTGNDGDNTISGGLGNDEMAGGRGDDIYIVDSAGDKVTEGDGEGEYWGHDRVESSVSFTLGANIEDLTLTGTGVVAGYGNALDNVILGNDGANDLRGFDGDDTLKGGKGADAMVGGAGIDTVSYEGSNAGVTVNLATAAAAGGDAEGDSVFEVENLIGSDHADNLTGDQNANRIDGGKGVDTLKGGAGDDVYVVDSSNDAVVENADEGYDRIEASASYTAGANIEEIRLTGSADIDATGNTLDNKLTGNFGANRLDGGAGNDTMMGGAGNDTYVVGGHGDKIIEYGGGGTDTVESAITYKLGEELENLTLTGLADLDGTGNAAANEITGNSGANKLQGLAGDDVLKGGAGGDTLDGGEGIDTASYAGSGIGVTVDLKAGTASGGDSNGDTFTSIENLVGSDHDDTLTGSDGENRLDGGKGNDVMAGGLGSDTYVVDSAGDVVSESSSDGGRDTVELTEAFTGAGYTLGANVENLVIAGKADLTGTGNNLENILIGNDGKNRLDGGVGADQMAGGFGDDTYVVDHQADVVTELADHGVDSVEASFTYTLGSNIENLTLTGAAASDGSGNSLDNKITGNGAVNILKGLSGNDTLEGGAGADTLDGGEGRDTVSYLGSASGVTVDLGAGTVSGGDAAGDILVSIENVTGSAQIDNLTGDDQDNRLDGGGGADTLTGGKGNDTYVVDDLNDAVVEVGDNGTDRVESSISYTIAANVENLTLTGQSAIDGIGNTLANEIVGNAGANKLDGDSGDDTLIGGGGGDQLFGGLGTDTASYISSSAAVTINLKAGTASGGEATGDSFDSIENLTGSVFADDLTGDDSANRLDGGRGNDTMLGGLGDDTYVVDNAGDVVTENAGQGTDSVEASISYALGSNLEDLTLTGTTHINATGNALDNHLMGNDGNNTLDGGGGADTMAGGKGDDIYVVDNVADQVIEGTIPATKSGDPDLQAGIDLVKASVSYTIGDNVENLTLTESSAINGTGNALDNTLTGNDAANTLTGAAGNDVLIGGEGNDSLVGGAGDDTASYVGAETGLTASLKDAGVNTGEAAGDSYAEIENLTGSRFNDTLTGDDGANRIDGGLGVDTLTGGDGNDVYVVDNTGDVVVEEAGKGTDTVEASISYSIATLADIENITLTGRFNIDATGNAGANTLTGNAARNVLDGGGGNDILHGGAGGDTYIVSDAGDTVSEYTFNADGAEKLTEDDPTTTGADEGGKHIDAGGIDKVVASINYILGDFVENLTLTGSAMTGAGNALDNVIVGTAGANTLAGLDGNDRLVSLGGGDTLVGGKGNDTYVVGAGDTVTEDSDGGVDTVEAGLDWTLGAHVENLLLTGTAASGTGNTLDNRIIGNDGINTLSGGDGNDTLDGGKGDDNLIGGAGDDTYVVDGADKITEGAGEGVDWVLATTSYVLADNVENLTLIATAAIDGTGNALDNAILGNAAGNRLDGGLGKDTLMGDLGADVYVVDNVDDKVVENENEGVDRVEASVSWVLGENVENLALTGNGAIDGAGNALDNEIVGNNAANILDGKGGNDRLIGGTGDTLIVGAGDDIYVISGAPTAITEMADGGYDQVEATVTHTLMANVEDLKLVGTAAIDGTGNDGNNKIVGNIASNVLTGGLGDDYLDGGKGADKLFGGDGSDIYIVDDLGDTETELADEGFDTVYASVSHKLGDNVEVLVLTGKGDIDGTGSNTANTLTGNDGNNKLDGGLGADLMIGGIGDDIYVVDSVGDLVVESWDSGTDAVLSSQSYTLGDNLENLTLLGNDAINGTGNALDNWLVGNAAANTLLGDFGDDVLEGGAGADILDGGFGTNTASYKGSNAAVTLYASGLTIYSGGYWTGVSFGGGQTWVPLTMTVVYGSGGDAQGDTLKYIDNLEGSDFNDTLNGSDYDNRLDGGLGADTLNGGAGNDVLVVDNQGDVVSGGTGTDTVEAGVSYTITSADIENLTLLGKDNLSGTGNSSANTITGNDGVNILDGGSGNDILIGGLGGDTLKGNTGIDSASYIDAEEGITANLLDKSKNSGEALGDSYDQIEGLIGSAFSDVLVGDGSDNRLDGGLGADKLTGGAGNDTYVVDSTDDQIIENAKEGIDAIESSVSYIMAGNAENVENLTLTGTLASFAIGNALDNKLTGNEADNRLDGGAGIDTMVGGKGDDTYVIRDVGDTITENSLEGTDTAEVALIGGYTLGTYVENLVLIGSADNGTGNASDNMLIGNSIVNILNGGSGNDLLIGGAGNDTLNGSTGTGDTASYAYLTAAGVTAELKAAVDGVANAGIGDVDTLQGIENLIGSSFSDTLIGDTNANRLDGGMGADSLTGGAGNDTYVVDDIGDVVTENSTITAEIDTVESSVTFTLGANLENLVLKGAVNIDGSGNASVNILTGNDGNNRLDGGAGADTMKGGKGDDTYVIDNAADVVTELAGEGQDAILTSVGYDMVYQYNVENLSMTGSKDGDLRGNNLDNTVIGNDGANKVDGYTGTNILIGGKGDDTLYGYYGTDTADYGYLIEGGVTASLTAGSATAGAGDTDVLQYIENLTGSAFADILTGDAAANRLEGGAGNDLLEGAGGADTLIGGIGNDTLKGGAGDDIYVIEDASDTISENAAEGTDTVKASLTWSLANIDNVENLTLIGSADGDLTGNGLANVLTGNDGANKLDGGAGNDTMKGGKGDDLYVVDATGDTVTELTGEGLDTVQSMAASYTLAANVENLTLLTGATSGTGNALDNVVTGNDGANTLDGGTGNDTLIGFAGNDTLVGGSGTDAASYAYLASGSVVAVLNGASDGLATINGSEIDTLRTIENLVGSAGNDTLTGDGNANRLEGGAGNDSLNGGDGNDILIGGFGEDTLNGGAGNDLYIVEDTDDIISDSGGTADLVEAAVNFSLASLGAIENLTLTGLSAIDGTGNGLVNILIGNDGANKLDGGAGNDTMKGGKGDDVYVVDTAGDIVTELTGEGFDTVQSMATSYTLTANVENLRLLTNATSGTGNALDNALTGNDGANTLDGGTGNDTLIGQAGNDTLIGGSGIDTASYAYLAGGSVVATLNGTSDGSATINGSEVDTLRTIENLIGSAGNDTLTGDGNANRLEGGAGNDNLSGAAGIDELQGGDGDDVLQGGAGADQLEGGAGNDWASYVGSTAAVNVNLVQMTATGGDAVGDVFSSIENLRGSNYADTLVGSSADNTLEGGLGNDTLNGGVGSDTASYAYASASVTASLITNTANAGAADIDTLVDIENLVGGAGNDTLTGNDLANRLDGGLGNDVLTGGKGDDVYVVNANDTVNEVSADGGIDTVEASVTFTLADKQYLENVTLTGSGSIDATGNALDNKLTGNGASNTLTGGAGNDTLDGGAGNDTLIGGEGADTFRMERGSGQDLIDAFDADGAADKLLLGDAVNFDQLWFTRNGDDLVIDIIGSNDRMTVQDWYAGAANQLDRIELSDGSYADASDVEQLRAAMAAFAPPSTGELNLDPTTRNGLSPVLAASWHSNQAA
ncbi:MAG: hypothetical protein HYU58_08910 [Proteobacteria bacterium]|nr:hypothetical protein [Pseudomonadota bacterium]